MSNYGDDKGKEGCGGGFSPNREGARMLGGGVVDWKDVDAIETTLIRLLLFEGWPAKRADLRSVERSWRCS